MLQYITLFWKEKTELVCLVKKVKTLKLDGSREILISLADLLFKASTHGSCLKYSMQVPLNETLFKNSINSPTTSYTVKKII